MRTSTVWWRASTCLTFCAVQRGNWSLDICAFCDGSPEDEYLRAVFNKLQPEEEMLLPATMTAGFVRADGSPEIFTFLLDAGKNSFDVQWTTTSTLTDQPSEYIRENKLEISFEIVQCSIKYGYNNEDTMNESETLSRTGKALQDFSAYLNQGKLADLEILVDKRIFSAHKIILAASSPVFAAMFDAEMKEAAENKVELKGFSEQVVEEFLHFLYTGSAPNLITMSKNLLRIAHFYQVDPLLLACENVLCDQLTVKNAAEMLLLSNVHAAKKLKTAAKNFIVANLRKVVATAAWKDLMKEDNQLANEILEMLGSTIATSE